MSSTDYGFYVEIQIVAHNVIYLLGNGWLTLQVLLTQMRVVMSLNLIRTVCETGGPTPAIFTGDGIPGTASC